MNEILEGSYIKLAVFPRCNLLSQMKNCLSLVACEYD